MCFLYPLCPPPLAPLQTGNEPLRRAVERDPEVHSGSHWAGVAHPSSLTAAAHSQHCIGYGWRTRDSHRPGPPICAPNLCTHPADQEFHPPMVGLRWLPSGLTAFLWTGHGGWEMGLGLGAQGLFWEWRDELEVILKPLSISYLLIDSQEWSCPSCWERAWAGGRGMGW